MKRNIFIVILTLTVLPLCHAQRQPSWMNELPKAGNSTIVYVRESGEGRTIAEATNMAMLRVMQSTANRIGRPFDAAEVDRALGKDASLEAVSRQYNIPINKVDQYDQRLRDGSYRVWVLCQVAATGNVQPQWEELPREGEAGNWTSLAKSVVVPGLGQMGKGHVAEGWLTLGGEALLVGTGVGCYFMAQQRLEVMRDEATAYDEWKAARSTYGTLRTVSYIAWDGAAVLYAFNLYRAFAMQPRRAQGIALAPAMLPTDGGMGAGISITLNL